MKKSTLFIMKQMAMVQWHRSFRSKPKRSLWTQNSFVNSVLKFFRIDCVL
ncbi:hypothetical protein [Niastella populi]|nr:hypothetical protein [Niastella populi]